MDTTSQAAVVAAEGGGRPGEGDGALWAVVAALERAVSQAPDTDLPTWLVILAHRMATHLEPRISVEEQSLLPRLRRNGQADAAARARVEHAQLRALLRDDSLPLRERLSRFALLLRAHLLFERQYELSGSAAGAAGRPSDCIKT